MEMNQQVIGKECEMAIRGRFTFIDHLAFKSIFIMLVENPLRRLTLDFSAAEFIDSAALGILLLLRDETQKHGTELLIKHPVGQVKQMFELTRFYDLFTIQE